MKGKTGIPGDMAAVEMARVGVVDMVADGCGYNHSNGNTNTKGKPYSSGFYPPLSGWNKLSFKECDKIQKECDKKGKQGRTK